MLFNTLAFAKFFVVVYLIYLVLDHRRQNWLLLAASYFFYCWWDWRFSLLIALSTIVNYVLGIRIDAAQSTRSKKTCLNLAVLYNLGMLGFFKYFDFFSANLNQLAGFFGWQLSPVVLNLVLPLGISFYTFQVMSYTIDIHRGVIRPTRNFTDFALFVAFFPQLVAGPIERARNLLPQFSRPRQITRANFYEGGWLIFLGIYKKIFVADNLARITTAATGPAGLFGTGDSLIGMYAYAFQVYVDFSGYSDVARGLAKLLGIDLMRNFRFPFLSANIADFWQRWHISLTTWIKEYVYYPLALTKFFGRSLSAPAVILITWAVMGFWHGAMWKFIVWGIYHGLILVAYHELRPHLRNLLRNAGAFGHWIWHGVSVLFVFHLFAIGILFFARASTADVWLFLMSLFAGSASGAPWLTPAVAGMFLFTVAPLVMLEVFQYRRDDDAVIFQWPVWARGALYYVLFYSIVFYGAFTAQRYYYFQF